MINIHNFILNRIKTSYKATEYITKTDIPMDIWKVIQNSRVDADYSCASLIDIAKTLSITPDKILTAIIPLLESSEYKLSTSYSMLNISLTDDYINECLHNLYHNSVYYDNQKREKIIVDFSSPNIAKDLHVGHLRSTVIGDSICKLFEYNNFKVFRLNHIGDYGTNFGMLIQYLFETAPDFQINQPNIENLQEFYTKSKQKFDTDEEFKAKAYQKTILLQQKDKTIEDAWRLICDISKKSFNDIYKRLNVNIEECGESFYRDQVDDVIKELIALNLVSKDNGAHVIDLKKYGLKNLMILKSDGGYTYDTTDLAAIRYRLKVLNANKIFYVVDSGQALHFQMIFKVAELANWSNKSHSIKHINFGVVLNEEKKRMKSRNGHSIPLKTLLDNALTETNKALNEHNSYLTDDEKQIIAPKLAYGAIKYADLVNHRETNYIFSYHKMLNLNNGNTVMYQQYAHVRLKSILKKVKQIKEIYIPNKIILDTQIERKIAIMLIQLPELLDEIMKTLCPHKICTYLFKLSELTQSFCTKCRCITYDKDNNPTDVNMHRVILCILIIKIQNICFQILNIDSIDKI